MSLEHSFVGYGNPLLDISATVPQEFFDKYKIKRANAILAKKEHFPMYGELEKNFACDFLPGGSSLNTTRAVQWMLNTENACAFVGTVGKDKFERILRDRLVHSGVDPLFLVVPEQPTGCCAVLLDDKERSLIANLGAAEHYDIEHTKSAEISERLSHARFFFMESFFLTHSPNTALHVVKETAVHDQFFALSLSATFLVTQFLDRITPLLPYVDLIFANEDEAAVFGKSQNWEEDLDTIAKRFSLLPLEKKDRKRCIVFTQGKEPTIVGLAGEVFHVPVQFVDKDKIIDFNGAGDSFAGGFMAKLVRSLHGVQGFPLTQEMVEECCLEGNKCASVVIQETGCRFPSIDPNK